MASLPTAAKQWQSQLRGQGIITIQTVSSCCTESSRSKLSRLAARNHHDPNCLVLVHGIITIQKVPSWCTESSRSKQSRLAARKHQYRIPLPLLGRLRGLHHQSQPSQAAKQCCTTEIHITLHDSIAERDERSPEAPFSFRQTPGRPGNPIVPADFAACLRAIFPKRCNRSA